MTGWAWDRSAPDIAVEVSAYLDGKLLGRVQASEPRDDVAEAGHGTGRYGFTLTFSPSLDLHDKPELFASTGNERAAIQLVTMSADPAVDGAGAQEPARGTPEGHVDLISNTEALGWVWNPSDPDETMHVEAVLGETVVGRAPASMFRKDVMERGCGSGRYGFKLAFRRALRSGQVPVLRAVYKDGTFTLPSAATVAMQPDPVAAPSAPTQPSTKPSTWSPPTATSLEVEGYIDTLTRTSMTGWAWRPGFPAETLEVEAVLDNQIIGTATANQPRPDLVQWGKGTGLYGFKLTFYTPLTGDRAPTLRVAVTASRSIATHMALPPVAGLSRARGTVAELLQDHATFTAAGAQFEEFDPGILKALDVSRVPMVPLVVAYYLPQFHSIPENDRFWGTGFTEWRQLPKGISRFPGHYQPRTPRDLGFYNLTDPQALEDQARMAKAAGIGAFAFYYYWFNGKRVLERPLEQLLESDTDMPFMLIWANENWTKTWDGHDSEVLLRQDYKEEDEGAMLADIARHLVDPRHVQIDGRPLFVIYNPKHIPDTRQTIARWRGKFESLFGLNPLIFMAQAFDVRDPVQFGLDGAIEFPPHKLANHLPGRDTPDSYSPDFTGRVIAYDDFIDASLGEDRSEFPLIKTIVPSWDNEARRPNRGFTLEGSTPAKYQEWLRALVERAIDEPVFGTPIVAVNAWNEWAEAAYLEPDVHFGAAYLNATARACVAAVNDYVPPALRQGDTRDKVTVILPNFNHARFLPERIGSVLNQTRKPDEIIFLDDCSSDDSVAVAKALLSASGVPYRIVANKKNSGCVFKQWVKGIDLASHDLIWIAETDDSADLGFLANVLPAFEREDVRAAYGRITCIDGQGAPLKDLDRYYDGLKTVSWKRSQTVPAHRLFSWDFAIRNVVPNASGLVFRKPVLSKAETARLYKYKFAGDWYFYALMLRGGSLAYQRDARSYFRINRDSTSRTAFFTDQHLLEHQMVITDLQQQYGIGDEAIDAHAAVLSVYFPGKPVEELGQYLRGGKTAVRNARPLRVCVAAHSFAVGGGEVLPLELANNLRAMGHHVTYLVMEKDADAGGRSIRPRLRSDIPVVHWEDVRDTFGEFLDAYGIEVLNSHNVGVEYNLFRLGVEIDVAYVASLHGGYETVPELITPDFVAYLDRNVDRWLYLSDKNKLALTDPGLPEAVFERSFNAVPNTDIPWVSRNAWREQNDIPEDAFCLVICSRAIEEKGWQTAIDVCTRINEGRDRPVYIVLIGDGPAAEDLRHRNAHLAHVRFTGFLENPMQYFRCFDLGIFPSVYVGETFPLFLLECFEAGLPVVSTDIGEIPHIMGDDPDARPGATVPRDASNDRMVEQMSDIVAGIVDRPAVHETMVRNAAATAGRFSIQQLSAFYVDVFSQIKH